MKMQQYTMIFSSATLLLVFTGQSSLAFSITGPRTGISVSKPYGNGSVTVQTIDLQELSPPSKDSDFIALLQSDFKKNKGWVFERSNKNLTNNLIVTDYKPCLLEPNCTRDISDPDQVFIKKDLGAALAVQYQPTQSENNLAGDFSWIQRIFTNDSGRTQNLGNTDIYIDNGSFSTPFYPGISVIIGTQPTPTFGFVDAVNRVNYKKDIYWYAELYLVKALIEPKKNRNTITIYNGIKWGWTSKFTPNPTPKPCSSASGGGGCVTPAPVPINSVRPVPTPRPIPRPTLRPTPRPSPSPTPWTSTPWTSTPWTSTPWTSTPWTSTPWTSTPWTSTPWTSSPLGSTSSTVVVSTSTTTITSPSPFQGPSSPAPSPRPAPAPAPRPGGRPIQAAPLSAISKGNAANLRSSSLFESGSKANTDYLAAISSDLLEDSELSSTDSSLNNAKVAGISRDLLEDSELSSTDSNENQVNLADISSDLLEDSELSSTHSNQNQVNLAGISSDLLEDPELSSTDNDENNADIASISADLLQDQELSSEDNNFNQVDLAGISADLLEDPELSYVDDTLTAEIPKVLAKNTDDDALSAEAVPEPTTALGTLLALAVLPVIKKLTNRKNQE